MKNQQLFITPAAGKQLIAMGVTRHPRVQQALKDHKLLIVGGTTNSYIVNELMRITGKTPIDPKAFYRGISVPHGAKLNRMDYCGDILFEKGRVAEGGVDLAETVKTMTAGDVIFKGANAINLRDKTAGVLIGNGISGGTSIPIISAVISKRVKLIIPAGLEKRVDEPINDIALALNSDRVEGTRMIELPGRVFTELDAVEALSGCKARLIAGGGVAGGEGGVYILIEGNDSQLEKMIEIYQQVRGEQPLEL